MIGIIAALHEEVDALVALMHHEGSRGTVRRIGLRDYHVGELFDQPCVLVLARIGKVAAAATTVTLIRELGATEVVFTGVAGGVGAGVQVGDLVVAERTVQHDFDARPLFARHEIPLLSQDRFGTDRDLTAELSRAAHQFLEQDLPRAVPEPTRSSLGITAPRVHEGLIASGDQFIADPAVAAELRARLPGLLAVEMEGAAVGQICREYGVPHAVLRTISDRADATAHLDFTSFLNQIASPYSDGVLRRLLAARAHRSRVA